MSHHFVYLSLIIQVAYSLNNGVGINPPMGYNTWNDFRCGLTSQDVKNIADTLVNGGFADLGYKYVNVDDCWAQGRDSNGKIYPDPKAFPDGMKNVVDYVHDKGLKFGLYTDRGTKTCAGRPGSLGYESIDAQTYAEWGVDYLKEDACFASDNHNEAFTQYALMRDSLNQTGRRVYFSICDSTDVPSSWWAPVGWQYGNSWRIANDVNHWVDVLNTMDVNSNLTSYAGPGGWNDPDMLVGSSLGSAALLTPLQSRAQFSMWCIMAAPLLMGAHVQKLTNWDLETFTNQELININQDPLGKQGKRVAGGNLYLAPVSSTFNIWAKPLKDGIQAVVFLNNANVETDVTCDEACFQKMGFKSNQNLRIYDYWAHKDIGTTMAVSYTATQLSPQGGTAALRFTPL